MNILSLPETVKNYLKFLGNLVIRKTIIVIILTSN